MGSLVKLIGLDFENMERVVMSLKIKLRRFVFYLLEKWKKRFIFDELKFLLDYCGSKIVFNERDVLFDFFFLFVLDVVLGMFLSFGKFLCFNFFLSIGKFFYKVCVFVFNKKIFDKRVDILWRDVLKMCVDDKLEWRLLYKLFLSKRVGDI